MSKSGRLLDDHRTNFVQFLRRARLNFPGGGRHERRAQSYGSVEPHELRGFQANADHFQRNRPAQIREIGSKGSREERSRFLDEVEKSERLTLGDNFRFAETNQRIGATKRDQFASWTPARFSARPFALG
jgi:hypothetical protein